MSASNGYSRDEARLKSAAPAVFLGEGSPRNSAITLGLLLFVIAGGLLIWILPFGGFAQISILFHAALGIIASAWLFVWQLAHWRATRVRPRTAAKTAASVGFWLLAGSIISGLWLTWQGMFQLAVGQVWSRLHLWTGIAAVPFLVWHMLPRRPSAPEFRPARRRLWNRALVVCGALFLVCGVTATIHEKDLGNAPVIASAVNPFAPTNVATETGNVLPITLIGNSASCGVSGCHTAIYREWLSNAHRWSAEDQFFQTVRGVMTELHGRGITEKCSGCHDPVSLLSGHKDPNLGAQAPGYRQGASCVVCHAVRRVDERGIGSYVLGVPRPYLFESSTAPLGRRIGHFLIRVYPAQHSRDYSLAPVRKADSCAPCHKEYDVIVPEQGPVQVETQYDDWKQGKWNTDPDPSKRLYCQQCHMYYLEASPPDPYDLKIGLGKKHRNHYFAAGNQFMPEALALSDEAGQIERVTEWLQGRREVPEIRKVWPAGPVIALKIIAPPTAKPGGMMHLQTVLSNNKAGHGFPTGPLNIVRAWLEITVTDSSGTTVFHSGLLDPQNHIESGSYILKPLAIDLHGRMIQEPDLWHPDGPLYRPAILPGKSAAYDYDFRLPRAARDRLMVRARLRYRKANQFFLDSVYPGANRTARVTDVAAAEAIVELPREGGSGI